MISAVEMAFPGGSGPPVEREVEEGRGEVGLGEEVVGVEDGKEGLVVVRTIEVVVEEED
jgi:hypothetical protein